MVQQRASSEDGPTATSENKDLICSHSYTSSPSSVGECQQKNLIYCETSIMKPLSDQNNEQKLSISLPSVVEVEKKDVKEVEPKGNQEQELT